MPTSLQALVRLAVLQRLGVFICALATLLAATSTASALEPAQTKTRVWDFDFTADNSVGLLLAASSGKHQGNRLAGVEEASGSLLAARGAERLIAPGGKKLAQQIARFRGAGGTGGPAEFLQHVNGLAQRARAAGNVVTGTVGSGPQAIANGTIFREGSTYVVTDAAGVVRSFVPNAGPGGVASEFIRLGGVP